MKISGINRRKTDWLVRVCYVNKKPKYQKSFPDSTYGSYDKSLQAAIKFRDECLKTEGDGSRQNCKARWVKNGFINPISVSLNREIYSLVFRRITSSKRYSPISSNVEIEEVAQNVVLSLSSKLPTEISDVDKYIAILISLCVRKALFGKNKYSRMFSTGLDGVELGSTLVRESPNLD